MKYLLILIFTLASLSVFAVGPSKSEVMLDAVTTTGSGNYVVRIPVNKSFQAYAITTAASGIASVEVDVEASNYCDLDASFEKIADLDITTAASGTVTSVSAVSDSAYSCYRGNVQSIDADTEVFLKVHGQGY